MLAPERGKVYNSDNGYSYEKTWSGVSGGGAVGPPQLKAGASYSHGVTGYIKALNKAFNLVPHTKGYQK